MKEIIFLNKNSAKWKKFEELAIEKEQENMDELADSFIQLTDDLSYARTFYPGSNTAAYLNQLAFRTHQLIYKNRKEKSNRIYTFWKTELPLVIRSNHRHILYSFIIFMVSVLIGIISTAGDDSFVRLILGDHYVNMTLANIENGDPMAVYKQMNGVDMFLGISLNNIWVAFRAIVFGVFLSTGSWYIIFSNGVMLGAFQCFFYQQGLLALSMLTIWIHGTLEISAIIIAGGAGITIGNSILFPGTLTRLASFTKGAKDGLKIAIGLIPVFLVAACFEGFVTRHTEMPEILSLFIIISSLTFVIWYFILYPFKVFKKYSYVKRSDKI